LIEGNILINLDSLIEFTSKQINKKNIDKQKIKSFIIDRYKVLLREKNIKYDVINCLVDNDLTFLSKTNERLVILNNFLDTKEGNELKLLWQRVSNILHIEEKQNKKIEILNAKVQSEYVREEVNIINAINNIEKTDDYFKMLSQRSSLKDITFEFFENLKINDSDPLIKNRRLSILALLREKLLDIGDLSKLEGS
jgi:glycyl-tRNA synthetase beta chain